MDGFFLKRSLGIKKQMIVRCLFVVLLTFTAGCKTAATEETVSIAGTIAALEADIAGLETEIADQKNTNLNQWDVISFLYTQMPYALEQITPAPPGLTITPTAYDPWAEASKTPTPGGDSLAVSEHPPQTRTGIEGVDLVIEAVLNGGAGERAALVQYVSYPCSTAEGLGGPPQCRKGEAEGTVVEAFPVLFSEGAFVRPDEIQQSFGFIVKGLLAVFLVPDDAYSQPYWPAGEYGIVFSSEDGGYLHSVIVLVEGGQIVRLDYDSTWPPFGEEWGRGNEFVLGPRWE